MDTTIHPIVTIVMASFILTLGFLIDILDKKYPTVKVIYMVLI